MERIKTVTVQSKQTLWDIALQEYGTADAVVLLLQSNPTISITDVLTAGQQIIVYTDAALQAITEIISVEPYASQLQQLLGQWSIQFQQLVDRYLSAVNVSAVETGTMPSVDNNNAVLQLSFTRTGNLHPLTLHLGSMAAKRFWLGTMAEYEAIETKDANTIYHIEEEEEA